MTRGRTINIYIPDSNPRGVKVCDIQNSIVKAIFIPRNKMEDVNNREELKEPGIYFLFGKEDENTKPKVYIGEAENLLTRIKQHNRKKDFWNTAICFISEKKNINKAHIKYLESYCCEQSQITNKYILENGNSPTQSSLTERDQDFVLSFFDDLKILIATLGFPIFEETKKEEKDLFFCKSQNSDASGEYSEDGMVVFASSKANVNTSATIGHWAINLRNNLIEQKIMQKDSGHYIFTENYTFNSPSAATAVLLGRSANGWTSWKDKKGKTLDERFRK
ncbi:MAG: hypothetical protein A2493_01240 [Candidatus Magasanikbacteria bacterium RIFOXYC12_FULL_33_11]|uniref:GIY-YIG domain-containing protein n=1 Tax=Candidatus Magasanikbacteria bacterium RIFOXYC12_FULL_33_11 TaxID=1798701 RepID=A0A1F6NMJ8_9BACT|nr:MAG: hypothetical protein A2493_01240 [Candidatus Magasanikbacteria bacterium RIFOXYC12_FULL_33_11]